MNSVLEQEIIGSEPVTVTLADTEYPLAFPMFACALYKRETAKLDRARRDSMPHLSKDELRELRGNRRQILRQADVLQERMKAAAKENPEEPSDPDTFAEFYQLLDEAMEIRRRLDEEAAAGDSLFLEANWFKIAPSDPERVLLALWAGLHRPHTWIQNHVANEEWRAPFTLAQLEKLVDPANAEEVVDQIGAALRQYAVKKKAKQMKTVDQMRAKNSMEPTKLDMEDLLMEADSPSSGPSRARTSDSAKPIS